MRIKKPLIPYSVKLVINIFTMTLVISYLTFFLIENFADQGSVFIKKHPKSDIYILDSTYTRKTINEWGLAEQDYSKQLEMFASFFNKSPYKVRRVNESQLASLSSDSVLLILDAVTLSDDNLMNIEAYVNQGGSLLINHQAGFNDPAGNYRGGEFVKSLTGLEYNPNASEQLSNEGLFVTPKIFSPVTEHLSKGKRLSLVVYEQLPLFKNFGNTHPDVLLTNWARSNTPISFDKKVIPLDSAGAMWHGHKEKGRWVYFNFPSYVFDAKGSQAQEFDNLLKGVIDFLRLPSQIQIMPYLNYESVALVFEDVEYQYETIDRFIDLANRHQVPLTTFQVVNEALLQPDVLKRSQTSPLIEVASHSYSHGEIVGRDKDVLEKELVESKKALSTKDKNVVGFRPPREEIDEQMINTLIDADYSYVLSGAQDNLYPEIIENDFVVLPRTGTDDYEFFVKGNMSFESIRETVALEENLIRSLNGIYTLGVHTHLMTYGENIDILDDILRSMKQNKSINLMTAREIVERVRLANNVEYGVNTTSKNHIINLTNHNQVTVDNLVLRLYWQGSEPVNKITSDIVGSKVSAKHFIKRKYSDIHVARLKANANMSIVVTYE